MELLKTRLTFLVPLLALISGIILWKLTHTWQPALFLIGAGLMTHVILLFLSRNPGKALSFNRYHYLWIWLEFMGIGVLTSWLNAPSSLHCETTDHFVKGTVKEIVSTTQSERILIDINAHGAGRNDTAMTSVSNVKAYVYAEPADIAAGDVIIIPCRLSPIEESRNRRSTGYTDYLRSHHILYHQRCDVSDIVRIGSSSSFTTLLPRCRDAAEVHIQMSGLAHDTKAFLSMLLLGSRNAADRDMRRIFSDAGISHILALSGMHIAIIAGIFLYILFPLNIVGRYKLRYLFAIIFIWCYVLITGCPPSAVRAAVMTSFCFTAIILERPHSSLNALLAAVFIILILNPDSIADPGLQLSFMAVFSIIIFVRPLNVINHRGHPALYNMVGLVLTSLVAAVATCMISAYYFRSVPLMFLPANIIVLPLLPYFVALSLIYLAANALSFNPDHIGRLIDISLDSLIDFAKFITLDGSSTLTFSPAPMSVVIWCIAVGAAGAAVNRLSPSRAAVVAPATLAFALVCAVCIPSSFDNSDGFIIHKRSDIVAFSCYEAGKETIIEAVPHVNSDITLHGIRIVVIDYANPDNDDGILPEITSSSPSPHYVIISGGCYAEPGVLASIFPDSQFLLHPSINKKKELHLRKQFHDLGIEAISMRDISPVEVSLKKTAE